MNPIDNVSPCCPKCGRRLPDDGPCAVCALTDALNGEGSKPLELEDIPGTGGEAVSTVVLEKPGFHSITPKDKPGDRIGRYKLLEEIGEGGCGVVYVAEQEHPVRRRVALKVIKLGMDTREVIARFETERQALALMDHPNIAKIFDAGATETGRPYFVMELVKGVRITDYCDRKHLSTNERLLLFVQVCHAIQHAHQKGIIHRDIKPSNVLVTLHDGVPVPKVIDFGIAKATSDQRLTDKTVYTAIAQFIGTPAYMSPEQAELSGLDIDTRSDIYALGVLLYELLTGKMPFDSHRLIEAGLDEIRRIIREEEPPRPSTRISTLTDAEQTSIAQARHSEPPKLQGIIRGDLDWIVMKTLEKDRTRRYETATSLAADVQNYLSNEPVLARPPSQLYRFQKLVRRNRLAVGAAATFSLLLVLWLGSATFLFFREQAARKQVAQSKEEVESKNAEYRSMLTEAANSDRANAEESLRLGRQPVAFAYLARACEYDPQSKFAAEKAMAALNSWHYHLPTFVLAEPRAFGYGPQFSPDSLRIVSPLWDNTALVWDAATGKVLVTLTGHTNFVWCAQFSPNGKHIVTASADNTARVWGASDGKLVATLIGHSDRVMRAQFSPDGTRIVTASEDKTARVWDAATGEMLFALVGHEKRLSSAQFSPDGARIVTASEDRTARVWDAATGKMLLTLVGHENWVWSAQFSPDGARIVTASEDRTARVWDAATGKMLLTLVGHEEGLYSAQFSFDGMHIVTASRDKTARVWDVVSGNKVATLVGHEDWVLDAQFSPDSKHIITHSVDKTARLWEAATAKSLATLAGHQDRLLSARFSPDGKRIVTASVDGTAWVWNARPDGATAIYGGHADSALGALISPDGKRIVTVLEDKSAQVRDAATGTAVATLVGHGPGVVQAQFSPDSARIVTKMTDKTMWVWDTATGKKLVALDGKADSPGDSVWWAQFSPDNTRIVSASWGYDNYEDALGHELSRESGDKTVWVWNAATGKKLTSLDGNAVFVSWCEFSPDGTRIITISHDKTCCVWAAATGKALTNLIGHQDQVHSVEFSPNGTRIVTASSDETARVWDADTGKLLATLVGHGDSVEDARFSPDGTRIVTASRDKTARVWDADTGKLLATLVGHGKSVEDAQFSPDGTRIVTASWDKTARVWDAVTGKSLTTLAGHENWVVRAQFSPNGTYIVTASADEIARVWAVLPPSAGSPPKWFPDFLRYMAQMRLNSDGELAPLKPADWIALRERLRGVLRATAGQNTPYVSVLRSYVHD